jgi:hypothetical protein
MFGLGGIYVEALGDVRFRVAPIGPLDAHDMLHGIRGVAILKACAAPAGRFRRVGRHPAAVSHSPSISRDRGADINPLLAFPTGVMAVDARILLQDQP